MPLSAIHQGLSNACLIFSLIIAGYGLAAFARGHGVGGQYLGVLAIGELLFLAQAAVGVSLAALGFAPARGWVHYLYGIVLVISLPGLYAFVRGRDTRQEALLYGLLGLFLAGVSLRGAATAAAGLP
jgi:hypothetical protein